MGLFLMTSGVGLGASPELISSLLPLLLLLEVSRLMMSLLPSLLPLKRLGLEPSEGLISV